MSARTPAHDVATTGRPPLAERLRREWYLFRFDWYMQDYPRRELKQIKTDLRAQLFLAALDVGMPRAIKDVGHPRVLAERYITELGTRLPRWVTGVVTAAVAVMFVAYLMMSYSFGSLDTPRGAAPGAAPDGRAMDRVEVDTDCRACGAFTLRHAGVSQRERSAGCVNAPRGA